jgi:nitrogenase-stabilizing/protective protein
MSTLDQLETVDCAEDYFELLGVPYDVAVLGASRLHVLRAFGLAIAEIDARRPLPPDAARLRLYRQALRRAHDLVARGAAQERRAFHGRCGGCDVAAGCVDVE